MGMPGLRRSLPFWLVSSVGSVTPSSPGMLPLVLGIVAAVVGAVVGLVVGAVVGAAVVVLLIGGSVVTFVLQPQAVIMDATNRNTAMKIPAFFIFSLLVFGIRSYYLPKYDIYPGKIVVLRQLANANQKV